METTSLDYAFGLLLERCGIPLSAEASLDDDPEKLLTITDHYPALMVTAMGHPGTWPDTNDALISFQINSDNNQYPDIQEAYYLVADYEQQLVINPKNKKPVHILAEPIGWISYGPSEDPKGNPTEKPEYRYTWVKNDNIWEVARRTGQDVQELLEHNDITNPENIYPGTVLHLPHPNKQSKSAEPTITYELHSPTKQMHITQDGGAYKWSFGDMSKSEPNSAKWAFNAPLEIRATAHVPVDDRIEKFYMLSNNVGNYEETSRMSSTIGFRETDVADGPSVELPIAPAQPIVTPQAVIEDVRAYEAEHYPNKWRETIRTLREPEHYRVVQDGMTYDLAQHKPGVFLEADKTVWVYRKCVKYDERTGKEVAYRIPDGGDKEILYGIPLDWLEYIDEDSDIDEIGEQPVAEKIAARAAHVASPVMHRSDKIMDIFFRTTTRPVKLADQFNKYRKRRDSR